MSKLEPCLATKVLFLESQTYNLTQTLSISPYQYMDAGLSLVAFAWWA